jgi:uncharacterized protein YndB with AHSA1/START domain
MKETMATNAHLAAVEARRAGQRWMLIFTRELRHPPEAVWVALTDPAQLEQWAPFDADRNLGAVGQATLTMADAGGRMTDEKLPATIMRAERPRVLEYSWGDDLLRWELEAVGSGQRSHLTLSHTLDDRDLVPRMAAGWHVCLDVAERVLDGKPTGRIVAGDAKQHGWEELRVAYEREMGDR